MSNVENQVVSMTFDNDGFEQGIEGVLASLENLRASLDFTAAQGYMGNLQSEVNSFNLSSMESALSSIESKFSVLGAVAFATIQDITHAGLSAAKELFQGTLGQVITGGTARSIAIEQAKFQFKGLGIDVEAAMQSALDAVSGTAYGLDEAAGLAAQFGAGGIAAGEQMTAALRGVAGATAIVSGNFSDMGSIFTDVAAQGKLTGAHLFSFSSRNINMAAALAKVWGTTEEAVRAAAASGEISFEEFAAAADQAFGEHATKANETYTGSLANVKAALNRLGEVFIAPKLEATRNVFNALSPVIDSVKNALIPLTKAWKLFVNIQAIKSINFLEGLHTGKLDRLIPDVVSILKKLYTAVGTFLKPIKEAFREIFPRTTGRELEAIADSIGRFARSLAIGKETADKVKRAFAGFFAVLAIGWEIVKNVFSLIGELLGSLSGVGSGFLNFSAGLGDSLVAMKEFLVDGGGIDRFFDTIIPKVKSFIDAFRNNSVVQAFGDAVLWVKDALVGLFGGATSAGADGLSDGLGRVGQRFETLKDILSGFGAFVGAVFSALVDGAQAFFDYISPAFDGLGGVLADSIQSGDFNAVLDAINTGLFAGIVALFHKFLTDGASIDLTGGVMPALTESFESLTGVLDSMQLTIKAGAIMKIAQAVGILTISMVALALIDSVALTKALTAIAVGFGQLVGTMALLGKITAGPKTAAQLATLAGGLLALGLAMIPMTLAILILGHMDLGQLVKGLIGLGGGLTALTLAIKPIVKESAGMAAAGFGLILIGGALILVATAVRMMGSLSLADLAQGLVGVGVALYGMMFAVQNMPKNAQLASTGASLLLLGLGLLAMAGAVRLMGSLSWDEMAKGLVGLGVGLGAMVLIGNQMQGSIGGAAAIGIMALSLLLLSNVIGSFSDMSWGEIAKGLVGVAGALLVVGALGALAGVVAPLIAAGGAAIGVMAIGLGLLVNVMEHMASLSWGDIAKSLVGIAAALIVLAGGSVLLAPAIPFMLAMGIAMLGLGAALFLFGAGAFLAARAFEILANAGSGAIDALTEILTGIIRLIPTLASELAQGMLEFFQVIVDAAPALIEGVITLLTALLEGIIEIAPLIGEAIVEVMTMVATIMTEQAPIFVNAGISIITAFLTGIRDNIANLATLAAEIITNFINGIAANISGIIQAGVNLIVSFINGIAPR
jgi:phage-related protein